MHVLIVDPSPLAQNLYRVLLRNVDPDIRVTVRENLPQADAVAELSEVDLMLIASRLLEGAAADHRALLTDLPALAALPKLVMVRPGTNGQRAAWQNLPNAMEVQRPFRPDAFERAVKRILKGV